MYINKNNTKNKILYRMSENGIKLAKIAKSLTKIQREMSKNLKKKL